MAADVQLRRAEGDDFAAWFDLFEEVATEGRWIGAEAPVERPSRQEGFARFLGDQAAMFLVESDGRLLGFIGVDLEGGRADLGMAVRDGHRGHRLGSTLMEACLDWCRDKRAHKVTLTVWPHNERGLALYRRYGFEIEGRLVRHYRRSNGELWDGIRMGLVLDTTSPGSPHEDAVPRVG